MAEECRKAFEEWAAKVNPVSGVDDALQKKPSGEYLWSGAQLAWRAWDAAFQAGRSSAAPCPFVVSGDEGTGYCSLNGPAPSKENGGG